MNGLTFIARIGKQKLVLLGVIIAITVTLSILSPQFLSIQNISNVLLQITVIIIIGCAANTLMLTSNFDLSIGSVLAFSGIMFAWLCKYNVPIIIALIITIIFAAFWGAINGFLVGRLRIVPVIATLGTQYAARGLAFLVARWDGGSNISTGLPDNFITLGRGMLFGVFPTVIIYMIISIIIFWVIEKRTTLGRYAYMIGDNKNAAKLSGINVTGTIILLYVLIGVLTGFCGAMQASRVGLAAANVGVGLEFDILIAIVLGGTSMMGGEGSIIGMVLGALIVGLTKNGLNLLGISFFYQQMVQGALLLGAVFVDQWMQRTRR